MANDIKILDHLNIDLDGDGIAERYEIGGISELPVASTEVLGGVKIGENLEIAEDGTLNAKTSGGSSQVVYGGIDTSNVIYELTSSVEGTEWVATEDCYFIGQFVSTNSNPVYLLIDGVEVVYSNVTSASTVCFPIFILKGQKIKYFGNNVHVRTAKIYAVKKSENILHEYSTEEKVVGKWIDGKPIYERVFTNVNVSLATADWHYVDVTIDNFKFVIDSFGFDETYQCFKPFGASNNNNQLWWRHNNVNNTINIIVVQYTKTTD